MCDFMTSSKSGSRVSQILPLHVCMFKQRGLNIADKACLYAGVIDYYFVQHSVGTCSGHVVRYRCPSQLQNN